MQLATCSVSVGVPTGGLLGETLTTKAAKPRRRTRGMRVILCSLALALWLASVWMTSRGLPEEEEEEVSFARKRSLLSISEVEGPSSSLRFVFPNKSNGILRPPVPGQAQGTAITIADEEDSYCDDLTYANYTDGGYKCLVSSSDGTSATIRYVTRREVDDLREVGVAFPMFPNETDVTWAGRRFNNLMEAYNALIMARACGRVVTLPRMLSPKSSSSGGVFATDGGGGGGKQQHQHPMSLFDCVDFRQNPPLEDAFLDDAEREKFCSVKGLKKLTGHQVSQYYRNRKHTFPIQNTARFDDVRSVAKRFILAYWGMRPGSYRCSACSTDATHHVVAHVRSGDIFDPSPTDKKTRRRKMRKGQPPVDFYVKAIRHSGATDVTVVSEDWKNPVLEALREYDWTTDDDLGGGGSKVRLHFHVGGNYEEDLKLMFCARTIIFGNTSMGVILLFSPNLESVYVGRLVDIEHSVTPDVDPSLSAKSPVPCEHCEMIDEPWVQPLLRRIVKARVFGYVTHKNYGPYQEFRGTKEHFGQMLNYADGSLVTLN